MLGVLPEYAQSRDRPDAEIAPAGRSRWSAASTDRVDLRSAGIKNAYFNIERLGAVVRRYVPNQYGTTISHLHGGLPTDRCMAEWWVELAIASSAALAGRSRQPRPRRGARIAIPADIADASARRRRSRRAKIQKPRRAVSGASSTTAGRDRVRADRGAGILSAGALEMKIEQIVLRQIRMPLVHFFETSFGRTTERDIILVEVRRRRHLRLGRSDRRRESLLQRGVDRVGVADRCGTTPRPRC